MNLELILPFEGEHFPTLGAYEMTDMSSLPRAFFGYPYNVVIKMPHHSWVVYSGGHHTGMRIWTHNHLTSVPWLKPLHQGRGAFLNMIHMIPHFIPQL